MSGDAFDALLAGWGQGRSLPQPDGTVLPSHHAQQLGWSREPSRPASRWRPGIAHGGAVATVFDDLYGLLLYAIGDVAVTRGQQGIPTAMSTIRVRRVVRWKGCKLREGRRRHPRSRRYSV